MALLINWLSKDPDLVGGVDELLDDGFAVGFERTGDDHEPGKGDLVLYKLTGQILQI